MEPSTLLRVTVQSVELELETNGQVFSPTSVDAGTLAMLSLAEFTPGSRVLDLGCGYGVVGILAARLVGEEFVTLCDINEEAVATLPTECGSQWRGECDYRCLRRPRSGARCAIFADSLESALSCRFFCA